MKYLIILCLMLMGCGMRNSLYYHINASDAIIVPQRIISVYVDTDFGAADKVEIDHALNEWNFALAGQIRLEVVRWDFKMEPSILKDNTNAWFILKINSDSTFRPADTTESTQLAFTDDIGGHLMYIIRDRLQNEDIKGITMHEAGHLLGAEHVGNYLMYHRFNRMRFNCIDYASVQAVVKFQHLDMAGVNYCLYESGL